jgi:copper oxidase (laccase) domain-containing protein
MIRQPNYEVGPELVARFTEADDDNAQFFRPSPRPGHALFDLPGLIVGKLRRAGVDRFEDIGGCTYADAARFYSYRRATHRREADYGRHVSAIAIVA